MTEMGWCQRAGSFYFVVLCRFCGRYSLMITYMQCKIGAKIYASRPPGPWSFCLSPSKLLTKTCSIKAFSTPFLAYKSQFPLGFLSMLLPLWAVLWHIVISWWVFQSCVAHLLQHAHFSDPFDSFCHHLLHHLLHLVDGPLLSPSFWEQSYLLVPSPGILGSMLNYVSQISILGNSRSTHPSESGPMLPLPTPADTCWQGRTTPLVYSASLPSAGLALSSLVIM